MTDTTNPMATIVNNSSIDVDVYDVYNGTGDANAALTYTKLGSVKKGETKKLQTIHFASQLQAMYTGTSAALNGNYYYQFPVAVIPIVPLGSQKRTSYTITGDDKTGMEQSFLFQKYVVANADSQVAKDFFAALSGSDPETAVDKFFAGTKNFKTCTLAAWTAVVTWSGQFTSAWQGPYYLYSVPPKDSTTPPKLTATVNISSTAKDDSAVLSMSDSSQSTALSMNGRGLQESNVGAGGISVSLKPAWMNVVQTDGQDGSTNTRYLIGSAVTGVVNGITVLGTGEKRVIPSSTGGGGQSDADKQRKEQQDQQNFDRMFSKITTLAGLAVSVLTAYFFYKQLNQGHTQKTNEATEQAAKKPGNKSPDKAVDDAVKSQDADYEKSLDKAREEIKPAEEAAAKDMAPALDAVAEQAKINVLDDVVDAQVDKLSEVLETKPPTDSLESTAEKLSDIQSEIQDIQDGKPGAKTIDDVTSSLKDVSTTIETEAQAKDWQDYEKDALESTKEAVDESVDVKESIDTADAEHAKEAETSPDDPDFDPEFAEPEVDPIAPAEGV